MERPVAKGRGSQSNPPNRFERIHVENDFEQLEDDDDYFTSRHVVRTEYFNDDAKSIISKNDSPDVPFRFSLNPYRGCSHGCSYCYARPTHEYLGLSAGLDFESKVFVKQRAPELFRDWLARDAWVPEIIALSGVTDCYQPCERKFQLTRRCLEVALEARQPMGVITKNALVTRDIDLLKQMSESNVVNVALSITTLDQTLASVMEPRTSTPLARLRAMRELADAGIPTYVMVAPIIPGLTDSEIPSILKAASEAGAVAASYVMLRLPQTVRPIFLEWLGQAQPDHKDRVISRIRATRDGQLSDSQFGQRMCGTGEMAEQIRNTFKVFARKYGLHQKQQPLNTSDFSKPQQDTAQLRLF